jgi:hypothetical protein
MERDPAYLFMVRGAAQQHGCFHLRELVRHPLQRRGNTLGGVRSRRVRQVRALGATGVAPAVRALP